MNLPDWCAAPIFGGEWTDLSGEESLTLAYEIGASLAVRSDLVTDAAIERLRVRAMPCYPGAMLIEMQARLGERRALSNHLYGSWGMVTLDGGSAVLHDLNEIEDALALETEEQVAAYHLLFCNTVRGDEGRFRVISPAEPIDWRGGAVPDDAVFATVSTPVGIRRVDDHWAVQSAIRYGDALFFAHFQVMPNGMIEMVDDEPVATGVLSVGEEWNAQYRIPTWDA